MSHFKTVVETMTPAFDKGGALLYKDGVSMEESTGEMYYLLHWGLQLTQTENYQPVTYTVGICQNIKTGRIFTFLPDQLRVVGIDKP
jgi:hypothetical protein